MVLETGVRTIVCNALVDQLDGGKIECRTLAAGADPDIDAGAELATLTYATPAYANAASGVAAIASAITSETSATAGTCGHISVKNAGLTVVYFTIEASAEFDFTPSNTFCAGATVSLTGFTIIWPA